MQAFAFGALKRLGTGTRHFQCDERLGWRASPIFIFILAIGHATRRPPNQKTQKCLWGTLPGRRYEPLKSAQSVAPSHQEIKTLPAR